MYAKSLFIYQKPVWIHIVCELKIMSFKTHANYIVFYYWNRKNQSNIKIWSYVNYVQLQFDPKFSRKTFVELHVKNSKPLLKHFTPFTEKFFLKVVKRFLKFQNVFLIALLHPKDFLSFQAILWNLKMIPDCFSTMIQIDLWSHLENSLNIFQNKVEQFLSFLTF